jgi:hypothetical protein
MQIPHAIAVVQVFMSILPVLVVRFSVGVRTRGGKL